MASFSIVGTTPVRKDRLIIVLIIGSKSPKHITILGIGSRSHDLDVNGITGFDRSAGEISLKDRELLHKASLIKTSTGTATFRSLCMVRILFSKKSANKLANQDNVSLL